MSWDIKAILPDGGIIPEMRSDKKTGQALKVLMGNPTGVPKSIIHACKISTSELQRNVIELLLLSEDCNISEIPGITGIPMSTIKDYNHIFFRSKKAFMSRLDILDYIETGIADNSEDEDKAKLMSFLFKRWTMTLGKEFVIWRFKLEPVDYTPGILFSSIVKEAYFYHKEKSMGKDDISTADYIRSTKSVLDSIKTSLGVKDESKDDDAYDMKKELDIIIEDSKAFDVTIEEMTKGMFINNG